MAVTYSLEVLTLVPEQNGQKKVCSHDSSHLKNYIHKPEVPLSFKKLKFKSAYSLRNRSSLWAVDKYLPHVTEGR